MRLRALLAALFLAVVATAALASSAFLPGILWRPYAGTHSLGFFRSPISLQGIWYGRPDNLTVGSVNTLAYERTQAWTVMSAVRVMAPQTSIVFTNVTNSPNYPGYELIVDQNGYPRVRVINVISSNYIDVYAATNIADNTWHYLAASYDGSSTAAGVKLYVDGVAQSTVVVSNTLSASILDGAQTFMIGNQPNHADFYMNGSIDEFSLSNIVRSAAYIGQHSVPTALPPLDANHVLYYHFAEGTGTTTADISASNLTGTLSSAVLWEP